MTEPLLHEQRTSLNLLQKIVKTIKLISILKIRTEMLGEME